MNKKIYTYLPHILGSLLFLSIPVLSSPDFNSGEPLFSLVPFQKSFFSHVLLLLFFYLNYGYLIPTFYFSKKLTVFFALIVVCYAVIAITPSLVFREQWPQQMQSPPEMKTNFPEIKMPPPTGMPKQPAEFSRFRAMRPIEGSTLFQFLLVFFVSLLLRINQRLTDIQSEKLNTEIAYLKAQINPHFLFNTLNSLHALAITKSDDAPEAIVKLSSLMRYVVTESSEDYVPLQDEIEYVKNYISLQKLRMDNSIDFQFEIKGNTDNKVISPLLLIPFIENAFKYGINPDEESAIAILIHITQNEVLLNVKNKKVSIDLPESEKSEKGTENTLKRIKHLYPDKHEITFHETDDTFEVNLKIELT